MSDRLERTYLKKNTCLDRNSYDCHPKHLEIGGQFFSEPELFMMKSSSFSLLRMTAVNFVQTRDVSDRVEILRKRAAQKTSQWLTLQLQWVVGVNDLNQDVQ